MAKVCGELVAIDWDENDEPLEIAIEMDGERYMIAHNEQYEELLRYLGHGAGGDEVKSNEPAN